jgi:RNA polymerase sigma-70 factor (ECF subfamily)
LAEDLDHCSDEELLRRHRLCDDVAFEALVRRYERELYGYLRRYLNDDALAEDVFQNTFLQVYLKRRQFEEGRPVRPWLYTIATRQAIDALRRHGRHQAVSLEQTRDASGPGDLMLLETLAGNRPGPDDEAFAQERRELVRLAVEQLPDFLKQVLLLAYYQGLKYREIADALGIPVGTVKSRLHAALQRLQESWADAPALHD